MSLTLYHSVESTCSQKVRIVMAEKSLDWEQVNLNLRKGDQFNPDYLALNPKAVVPTLVHGDKVIRESTVIVNYLEDVFTAPGLRPPEPYERSRMNLLIKAFDEEVHPSIGILSYAIVLRHQMNELKTPAELEQHFANIVDPGRRQRQQSTHHDGLRSPAARQALVALEKVIALMADIQGGRPWLCGDQFSLADASTAPYMVRLQHLGLDVLWQQVSGLDDWLQAMRERVAGYGLQEPWGSDSFHCLVAECVGREQDAIQGLLQSR